MEWLRKIVIAYSLIFSDLNTKEAQDLYLEACKPTLVDEMEEAVFVIDKYTDNEDKEVFSTILILTKKLDGEVVPFYRSWSPNEFELNFDCIRQQMYLSKHDYFVSQDVHDFHGKWEYTKQRGANRRVYVKSVEYYVIDTTPSPIEKLYGMIPKIELPRPQGDLIDFEDIYKQK